jgi:predicted phosphodiesterase
MKIQLVSDLHLEFKHTVRIPDAGADVLVLAGDICLAKDFKKKERNPNNVDYYRFFDDTCSKFKNIIYIMGNHEHYKSTFNKTANILKEGLSEYKNLHFLDNECVDIDGMKFIGSTLWTNVNTESPLVANKLKFAMNDYNLIKYCDDKGNYRKLSPYDTHREHQVSRLFLEDALSNDEPCVVITHHAPSFKSIHPKYNSSDDLNTLYASDLEHLMKGNIKAWLHGHTHTVFDYKIGDTRVVCNPHGYPGERKDVDLGFILDV